MFAKPSALPDGAPPILHGVGGTKDFAPLPEPPDGPDPLRLERDTPRGEQECPPGPSEGPLGGERGEDEAEPHAASNEAAAPQIRYSRGKNKLDAYPRQMSAPDFAAFVAAIDKDRAPRKGLGYICGPMNGSGHRCEEGALPRRWLPVDLDGIAPDALPGVRLWFARFSGCAWPTHSSKPDEPRERIIIELDREATRDECIRIAAVLAADLSEGFGDAITKFDKSAAQSEQAQYLPPLGVTIARFGGDPLNVDQYLARATAMPPNRGGAKTRRERASEEEQRDPVVRTLFERKMVKSRHGTVGWLNVVCPCAGEHTTESGETSTVYCLPAFGGVKYGKFICKHAHCADRPQEDFLRALELNPKAAWAEQVRVGDELNEFERIAEGDNAEAAQPSAPATDAMPDPWPGVLADAVGWIVDGSPRPQPELALLGMLIAASACVGANFYLPDQLRLNLYGLAVVDTGAGKDAILRGVDELAHLAGVSVTDRPASGEGLQDQILGLGDFARLIVEVDEAGHYLGGDSANVSQHVKSAAAALLRLFSDSVGRHTTRPKAGSPSKSIRHPGVALIGFSTPSVLGANLTEESISSGLLGRVLLVRGREKVAPNLEAGGGAVPESVQKWARAVRVIADFERGPNGVAIQYGEGVAEEVRELTMRCYAAEEEATDGRQRDVLRRSVEKMKRVAGVLAVLDDPRRPLLSVVHLRWAEAFVFACNAHLLTFIEQEMVGAGTLAAAARIKATVAKVLSGDIRPVRTTEVEMVRGGWAPKSLVLRQSKLPAKEFADAVEHLKQVDEIEVFVFKEVKSRNGTPASGFRLLVGDQ